MYSKRRKLAGTAVSPSKGRVLPWPPQPSAFRSRRPSKWERGTASTHRLPCPSHSCLFDDLWYLIWILKPAKSYFRNLVNNWDLYLVLRIQLKLTHRRKKTTLINSSLYLIVFTHSSYSCAYPSSFVLEYLAHKSILRLTRDSKMNSYTARSTLTRVKRISIL